VVRTGAGEKRTIQKSGLVFTETTVWIRDSQGMRITRKNQCGKKNWASTLSSGFGGGQLPDTLKLVDPGCSRKMGQETNNREGSSLPIIQQIGMFLDPAPYGDNARELKPNTS